MGSFFSKSRKRKFSEVRDSDIQEKGCYDDINSQHEGLATGVKNEERTEVKLVEGLDQLYGEHDIQVSEGGEAELHKHRRNWSHQISPSLPRVPSDISKSLSRVPSDISKSLPKVPSDISVCLGSHQISPRVCLWSNQISPSLPMIQSDISKSA
ncbi:hypothetical protein Btru_010806 [Bulinus truncatus]|nr:hypothetical protein Btru_010806 [Bulinus truncatus]